MKIGIILVNFGGPRSEKEILPFLNDIFKDVLPKYLKFLAPVIAKFRVKRSKQMYVKIGGSSPVVTWTRKQASALEQKLRRGGPPCPPEMGDHPPKNWRTGNGSPLPFHVYIGMKYGKPSVDTAIQEAKKDKCEKIILLPLFPYESRYTSNNVGADRSGRPPKREGTEPLPYMVECFFNHPLYIHAMVDIIKPANPSSKTHFLFSAHAVPISSSEPYVTQIKESIREIMKSFPGNEHTLAFQSQYGPIKWTGPSIRTTLTQLATQNSQLITYNSEPTTPNLLLIPLGFACENIETLYELDQLYLPFARSIGIKNISRTQALNDNPQFIDLLAQLVLETCHGQSKLCHYDIS